jgi:hypothetical protein
LFHYMHSLPMDMKRGCIGILIHPPDFMVYFIVIVLAYLLSGMA